MQIHMVITDNGDHSNSIEWVLDPLVIRRMKKLANNGNEKYMSGEGLQVQTLTFPVDFDLNAWIQLNRIEIVNLQDLPK